jgi:hypothetical protein
MQSQALGELNIPPEAENLTATYVAKPWSEIRRSWTFTTHSPLDKPTEVIGHSMGTQAPRPHGTGGGKN